MRRLARRTTEGRRTRRHPLVLTTMVTPLLLLALAACGEPAAGPQVASADGAATPSATSTSGSGKDDPNKFAACMRQHGVEVQVEDGGGIGISGKAGDEGKLEAAHKACQQFMPQQDAANAKPMTKEDQAKFLAYAKCMREHGVDMPDPEFEGGGVKMRIGGPGMAEVDQGTMDAAQKACQSALPQQMRPGAGGKGAGPGAGGGA